MIEFSTSSTSCSSGRAKVIINAFKPIQKRERLPLEQEIEMEDRIHFENILLDIYGISKCYKEIKASLLDLYNIRFAVKS